MSYNGSVFYNMVIDDQLLDSHERLPELYLQEISELAQAYGLTTDSEAMLANPF